MVADDALFDKKKSSFKIGPLEFGVSLSLMVQSTSQLFVVDGHEVDAAACKHLCHVMYSEKNRCVCLSGYLRALHVCLHVWRNVSVHD